MLLYLIYQAVVTFFFVLLFPGVFLAGKLLPGSMVGLAQRFGIDLRCSSKGATECQRIWIHAASVGEVQAARILIRELQQRKAGLEFFLSTMTAHGQRVARDQLPVDVHCFFAPLDVAVVVRRFLAVIRPDVYVCLETELWPAMFIGLRRQDVPALVLNGRLTPRSLKRYERVSGLIKKMLGSIAGVGAISIADSKRFVELGVPQERIRLTGNIKYDFPAEDIPAARQEYRKFLQVEEETVFICGSTRTGEEEKLLGVFAQLDDVAPHGVVWVIAPRHLERLDEVKDVLASAGLKFDLFSKLKGRKRSSRIVLVDTMGNLSRLYSAGDLNFVGGSLVDKRGHNIMEAARWGRPVYYGPSINDFKDAAEMLENGGGGFRVSDANALATLFTEHLQNKEKYTTACESAARAVVSQQGAARQQGNMVMEQLS